MYHGPHQLLHQPMLVADGLTWPGTCLRSGREEPELWAGAKVIQQLQCPEQ